MSAEDPVSLQWSAQFNAVPSSKAALLPGDKLLLPPSALEQLLAAAPIIAAPSTSNQPRTADFDPYNPYSFAAERHARDQLQNRQQQLPHPLTFRLVNPENGRAVYAGIQEFSAEEGEVVLSKFLRESLGLDDTDAGHNIDSNETMENREEEDVTGGARSTRITVHAKTLRKGTFVKLRPLEAGYDPEDWKSLLEQHLRSNFTTLTSGEILVVPGARGIGRKKEEFRFLIDGFKPEDDGICVVDTDLEVDIEALNEEQARETLKRIAAKKMRAPGKEGGSSPGGKLNLLKSEQGQVLDGEYVDYEIPSWIRSQGLEIQLSGVDGEDEIDLYVSPFGARQRAKPRADEYVFADVSSGFSKRIRLQPTNVGLEDAESVWVSVHAFPQSIPEAEGSGSQKMPKQFQLRAVPFDPKDDLEPSKQVAPPSVPPNPDDVQCKNCQQWFCHLEVPQEGDPNIPNPEALLSGLTPHELADGARTTECHLCAKIVRLRDMSTHLKHHDLERLSRPTPRICRNVNCGRTLDGANKTGDTRAGTRMGQGPGNDIGLCSVCFGPLYVSMYDPEGKALKRRVERRYLQQLLTGCGKEWCGNEMCKNGRQKRGITPNSLSTKDALPVIKSFVESLANGETPLHFCTDEGSQRRRSMAEMLAAEGDVSGKGGFGLEWCCAALEAEGGDLEKAGVWLKGWAPQRGECS
ncbi:uncharacterized protein K452DRAFT_300374 [Aplosporella prunicola CBS 121167]|uniref:Uncharacterized protein n=1 Tax=Aplosporella prunicola CBS 121167 TaxID=1176127 RepID=A0A6A6B9Z5_9PEZI|nr:uncharacterized protein K452DRAFT_300374 [Aplosporella prunicola CBS 121167]KAF2139311.1 hypothetical protein K452DRAFT_300374 [Aplosporella prunicola CBS 121167]